MNKFFLAIISLFNPLWKKMGVNVVQLRAILDVKLKMDDRRPNAYTSMRQQQQNKPRKNGSWAIVLVSLLMGFFYLFIFMIGGNLLLQFFLWFSIFMVMMSITLISDFTSVLIDVKDNYVILPRPVNDKTVVVSRLLHIMIHISKIVGPLAAPAFVYVAIRYGVGPGCWFGVMVLLLSVFCIFLINAVYLVALKLTTPQRFKEILNYLQIVFSIIVFATYYLAPRLVERSNLARLDLADYPWVNIVPTYWFARAHLGVSGLDFSGLTLLYIALAILVPFLSLWLVVKVFAPSFNRKLAMLSGSEPEAVKKEVKVSSGKMPLYKTLARLSSKNRLERLSFELVWMITGRSRDFKLKVYPSLAYVIVYFAYFLFSGKQGTPAEAWARLPETNMFILLIYISSFVFITAISNIMYSDKFKAAWVYYAAPVKTPGELLMGAFKATLVKFFLPFYIFIALFSLGVWGIKILPDLLLGFVNVVLINLLFASIYLRKLPFSSELNIKQGAGTFLKSLLILAIPGVIGFAHYGLRFVGKDISWAYMVMVIVFGLISSAILYLLYMRYKETGWEKLEA
jgi:ABC-2 type transport system permease protein